jgi:predicted solute-binding protein
MLSFSIIPTTFAITVVTTQTPERQNGLEAVEVAIAKVQEVITGLGGMFKVHMGVSN